MGAAGIGPHQPASFEIPQRQQRLLGLEAVRGIAALLVVVFHTGRVLGQPQSYGALPLHGFFGFGRAGVDVFFVLSGFIIAFIHAGDFGHPERLGSFAAKRFLRIFPSYWIASLLMLALMLASPTVDRREDHPGYVVWSLLLLPADADPLLGPGWSLRHELLFYTLFALQLLHARLGALVLGTWFAGIALNMFAVVFAGHPAFGGLWNAFVFAPLNAEFLFGIVAAQLALAGLPRQPLPWLAGGMAVLSGAAALESFGPVFPPNWPPLHLAYAVGTLALLAGLVASERRGQFRPGQWLVQLGGASYALYLLHMLVVLTGAYALRRLHLVKLLPPALALLALAASAVFAALLFTRWVETPLLSWLRPFLLQQRRAGERVKQRLLLEEVTSARD